MLMFDHPSGRTRVHMAMQWLKENPLASVSGTLAPTRINTSGDDR